MACPSVWVLKQFLEIKNPVDHPPKPSVSVDCSFIHCRTFEDTCTLTEIYNRILVLGVASPLELQDACVAGALF